MVGKTILGYHVDEKIGSGGFGTVYKVSKSNVAGTYVRALKHITLPTRKQYAGVLNSMGGDYAKADQYFAGVLQGIVSEISILSMLSESGIQNIVRYYENDITETPSPKSYDIYILMEYLTPFTDYIENHSMTVRDVIKLGQDVLKALMACHEKNIIHRDIKDDNIFVSADGLYKLGDFGVSKALKDKSRAESVKGTPNFIAPEVYLGKEKYDHTVDLYSLGIVLYKLLNKSRNPFLPKFPEPYTTADEDAAFEARMRGQIPNLPVNAINDLGVAVVKAIMPRQERYNSAAEFYAALEKVAASMPEEALSKDLGLALPTIGTTGDGTMRMDQTSGGVADMNGTMRMDQTSGGAINMNRTGTMCMDRPVSNEPKPSGGTIGMDWTMNVAPAAAPAPAPVSVHMPAPTQRNETVCVAPQYVPQVAEPQSAPSYTPTPAPTYTPTPTPAPDPMLDYNNVGSNNAWTPFQEPAAPARRESEPNSNRKLIAYGVPVALALIWIVVYLIVLPATYGKVLTVTDWLFNDPGKILDAVQDSSAMLSQAYQIILLQVFNWLILVGLGASVFYLVHTQFDPRPARSTRAQLVGKEPYYQVIGLMEDVKRIPSPEAEAAKRALYALSENLRYESSFGEGSDAVIDCENEIADSLRCIKELIVRLQDSAMAAAAARDIEAHCQKCNGKLKVRTQMKRK